MQQEDNQTNFNSRYSKARHNFLSAASESATLVKSWQHPLRGIAGEKLVFRFGLVW